MLYVVMEYEDLILVTNSLNKAKEFCMKQKHPDDYSIVRAEVNEEVKHENPYWYYDSSDNKWYRG